MRTKEDVVEEFRKQTICDAAMRVVARKGIKSVTADPASLADMEAPSDHRPVTARFNL